MNTIPKSSLFSIFVFWVFCCALCSADEEKSLREQEIEEALKVLKKSEIDLKKAYTDAENSVLEMWGDPATNQPLKELKKSQKAWLKWRDIESEVTALEISGGGYTRGVTAIYQKAEMNQARANRFYGKEPTRKLPNGEEDFSQSIGDQLVDQPASIYQGQLGSKGIFVFHWLPNKQVRGFFYPENVIAEYKIYGYNKKDGELSIQIFKGNNLFCSGLLQKNKHNGKLQWIGELYSSSSKSYATSMTKLDTKIPEGKAIERPYKTLAGFSRDTLLLSLHKNDTASGYLTPSADANGEGEEIYFRGVNYKKGYLFLEESGHFGDNEAVVGARLTLQKKSVNGALIWQGYSYHHNGDIIPVAFGRNVK